MATKTNPVEAQLEVIRLAVPRFHFVDSMAWQPDEIKLAYLDGVTSGLAGKRSSPYTRGTRIYDAWVQGFEYSKVLRPTSSQKLELRKALRLA